MEITVTDVLVEKIPVSLRMLDNQKKPRLYLGEKELGMPEEGVDYPSEVTKITFNTSDNNSYVVASHTLPYFKWREYSRLNPGFNNYRNRYLRNNYYEKKWKKEGGKCFRRRVKINGLSLSYKAVAQLKKGMVIDRQQAFHLMSRKISDGKRSFPLIRPYRSTAWKEHHDIQFAQQVPPSCWLLFLQAICGMYFDQVLHMSTDAKSLKQVVRAKKTITELKLHSLKGECYKNSDMQFVAIGANLLFTAINDSGKYYIVDSPEYGRGLYVFDDYQSAYDWATRKIKFREARKLARAFIPHVGKWDERVDAVL
jgi:hypothetical protein